MEPYRLRRADALIEVSAHSDHEVDIQRLAQLRILANDCSRRSAAGAPGAEVAGVGAFQPPDKCMTTPCGRADEQQEARRRLDEEAGQPLLCGPTARVKSVLRRASTRTTEKQAPARSKARFAGWTLDLWSRELCSPSGKEVELTTGEFHLLAAFVNNPQSGADPRPA